MPTGASNEGAPWDAQNKFVLNIYSSSTEISKFVNCISNIVTVSISVF